MAVDFSAIFKAQDKVSATLSNINKNGNVLESTFKKLAAAAAGVFALDKIKDFGVDSLKAFASFEQGMNEVFTLLPNASDAALGEMTNQVKAFSKEMGILPEQTVPALYQALSAGIPKDNVFEFLGTAQKAAVGGVTSLETAVKGLTSVVNSYGADVVPVQKASDLMFLAAGLGATTFDELSNSLYDVLPSAASSGVAFEDVTASLVVLTNMGVPTSVATTRVRAAIDELSKSGTKTDKIFRQIAGKSFKQFIAGGGNLQQALQMLENEAKKNNLGISDLFSSIEAGGAAISLTGKGTESFKNALEAMAGASGATEAAYEKLDNGIGRTFQKLKSKFEWLKVEVGQRIGNAMSAWFEKNRGTIDKIESAIGTLFSQLDKGVPFAEAFKTSFKDLIPAGTLNMIGDVWNALEYIFTKIKEIAGYITTNWSSVKPVVIGIGIAFATWKIGSVIYDTVTLGKAMFELGGAIGATSVKIWGNVAAKAADKAETAVLMAMYAGDFVRSLWTSVTAIGAQTTAFIVNKAQMGAQVAGMLALKGVQLISTGATVAMTAAQWALNAAFIASPIGWIVLGIAALIAAGVLLYKNWDVIKAKAADLWAGIQAGFKTFINFIISGLNFMINGINSLGVDIPDWVPLVGGKRLGFSIPEIPMLASGSTNAPETFIAGERGPELITGAAGSRVFPSDDTERIISALESNNRPISVSASPFASDDEQGGETAAEKTININLNGNGTIKGSGLSKEEILDALIVYIKPVLLSIIETEIFEEGDLAYEF
ncbi:phage tail tape measure protein [Dehalobacter sp. 14DCB1]|uniref:phage tail tape measure protein n=1 Tax=Dehalobacter sp. 14DCB1 TaxID=2070227 RepID=UPI00104540D0|nr:phage tail tape measure protein [Dehalobacter sp. 14DCB1]TCX51924.1 phage tail tape measure protein [Dehalobacter sp. 14DCB1]TCX52984.1 phage tail tape measure protein [Dehalobacter sp. 12DCB1]